jgi:hypothetical protein
MPASYAGLVDVADPDGVEIRGDGWYLEVPVAR